MIVIRFFTGGCTSIGAHPARTSDVFLSPASPRWYDNTVRIR